MRASDMLKQGILSACSLLLAIFTPLAFAHGVAGGDAAYLERIEGVHFIPLMYLGAKHMVTGYDHLLLDRKSVV